MRFLSNKVIRKIGNRVSSAFSGNPFSYTTKFYTNKIVNRFKPQRKGKSSLVSFYKLQNKIFPKDKRRKTIIERTKTRYYDFLNGVSDFLENKKNAEFLLPNDYYATINVLLNNIILGSTVDILRTELDFKDFGDFKFNFAGDYTSITSENIDNVFNELHNYIRPIPGAGDGMEGMPDYSPLPELDDTERLTKDFCISAFYAKSPKAKALGIDNKPDKYAYENIKKVAKLCQAIKDELGEPIRINSCYRCPQLNEAVGGSKTSDHMFGAAADISTKHDLDSDNAKLYFLILKMIREKKLTGVRQVIWEFGGNAGPSWVHVAVNHPKAATRKNHLVFIPKDKGTLASRMASKFGISSSLQSYIA
jgi:hypothetical protein